MIHDIIVFENIRFRRCKRKREASVIKNLHCGERFRKDAFSVTVLTEHVWTVRPNRREKSPVLNNGYVWTGPIHRKLLMYTLVLHDFTCHIRSDGK